MLYAVILFLDAALSLALTIAAERRRGVPGRRTFAILLAAVALWLLAYGLELVADDRALKQLWAKVQYFGIVITTLAWFRFALQYAGQGSWLTRRRQTLVLFIPILTLVLVWSNEWHGLVWQEVGVAPPPLPPALAVKHGPWFWAWLAFAYALVLAGCAILLRTLGRAPRLHRRQGGAILSAVVVPWLANVIYVLELGPTRGFDLTPFGFLFSGLALAWNMRHRRFLVFFPGLIPIAHDAVVESMQDGIVLLDSHNRMVDINPAAARLFQRSPSMILGQPFDRLSLPMSLEDIGPADCSDFTDRHLEITLGPKDAPRHYDVSISPVRHYRGRDIGRLLVFHDVTERRQTLETLRQREDELLMALEAGRMSIWEWQVSTGEIRCSRAPVAANHADTQHPANIERLVHSVHPGDQDQLDLALQRAVAEGTTYQSEYRLARPDGRVQWIEACGRVFTDATGQAVRVRGICTDVTDRKQAEAALAESEERLRLALTAAGMATWDYDLATDSVVWSDEAAALFGQASVDGIETFQAFLQLVHPADRSVLERVIAAHLAEKSECTAEFRIVRPDGTVRWLASRGRVFQDADGRQARMLGTLMDITDRKCMEEALRHSEARFRSLVANIPGIIYRSSNDPEWTMHFMSTFAEQVTGYPANDFLGNATRSFGSIIHPSDRQRARQAVQEALGRREPYSLEYRLLHANGDVRWVHDQGQAVFSEDGSVRWLDGVVFDITARQAAEAALRASEARFRSLAEFAPIGILQLDRDGSCTYANSAWRTLSSTSSSTDLGDGWLQAIAPQDRSALQRELFQALGQGGRFEQEVRFQATEGLRWARLFFAPMLGDDGEALGGVVTATDITPSKRLEEQRKQLLLLEERERIAMDLHDGIIQSLYAIALRLASQERSLAAAPVNAAGVLRQSRRDVDAVIREARAYIEALRPRCAGRPNLQDGLRLLVERLQGTTSVQVALDIDDEASQQLDSETAAHALYVAREAISNVMRHARASTVTIRLEREGDGVILAVHDDGVGFDSSSVDRHGGNGLRNMEERAALIGARLDIQSRPGGGTHVCLRLPTGEAC